jgi:spore coat polysaccharide biosynthesis protein SpsF
LQSKNILIRCDASSTIGLGHITRCIALAKQLQQTHSVYFAIRDFELSKKYVLNAGFEYFIINYESYEQSLLSLLKKLDIGIFIADIRDGLETKTIQKIKNQNILTVAIDEPSDYAKECDICFYPPHAKIDKSLYKGEVYQGLEYVMLREEFYQKYTKKHNEIPNILVMMGGTDPNLLTLKIVKQLLALKQQFNIRVILNPNHKEYDKIRNIDTKVSIFSDIENMALFLSGIDFAVVAFGTSAYELIAMQIPAIHICLDDDHWEASEYFEKNGFAKRYMMDDVNIKSEDLFIQIKCIKMEPSCITNKIIEMGTT